MDLTNFTVKKLFISVALTSSFMLTACGGGSETTGKIEKETKRIGNQISDIADDVKNDYREFEDKLSNDEKSMAEILESVFLPESTEENFKEFLDKLTPEGGKGGLFVGHFVEINDGKTDDVDIGAIYFDIPTVVAGSINGRISYQQQSCQKNHTLSAKDASIKTDDYIVGKFSGSLDMLDSLDQKFIRDLNIKTPSILTTFSGKYAENSTGTPWNGSFEYQDGLGGVELSSGESSCNVSYTLSKRSNFQTYPLDYELGSLEVKTQGTGSATMLTWKTPNNATLVLISQLDISKAESNDNGYIRNEVIKNPIANNKGQYIPVISQNPTNYAFIVQVFDENNNLIGYDALVKDLPQG